MYALTRPVRWCCVFTLVPRSLVTRSAAVCLNLIYAVCLLILDLHISLLQEL